MRIYVQHEAIVSPVHARLHFEMWTFAPNCIPFVQLVNSFGVDEWLLGRWWRRGLTDALSLLAWVAAVTVLV